MKEHTSIPAPPRAEGKNIRLKKGPEVAVASPSSRSVPCDIDAGTPPSLHRRQEERIAECHSPHELQTILDALPSLVFHKDGANRIVKVNDAFARAVGRSREEIEGRSLFDLTPDYALATSYWEDDKEVMLTGMAKRNIVERLFHSSTRWYRTDKIPYFDENGDITGVVGFCIDITELKAAEEELSRARDEMEKRVRERTAELGLVNTRLTAEVTHSHQIQQELRQAEETSRVLLDTPGQVAILLNADGTIIRINKTAALEFGCESEAVIGRHISDMMPSDVLERRRVFFEQAVAERRPVYFEDLWGARWQGGVFSPILDDNGRVIKIAIIGRDITERKNAEQTLRTSERRFRLLAHNMPVLIKAFDDRGRIIFWNRECEKVTGYSAELIIGNGEALSLLYPDTERRDLLTAEWDVRGNEFRDWEKTLTCRDGSQRIISWSNISDLFPISGWTTWAIGVDMTQRKLAEQELQTANERLRIEREALWEKNAALREILNQIDEEKRRLAYQLQSNVERLVMPLLEKLRIRVSDVEEDYVRLLKDALSDITSPFIQDIRVRFTNLTPRELEICNMIRTGMTSKEIAGLVNSAETTVRKHRRNIRRKLGISKDGTNLTSFLQNM